MNFSDQSVDLSSSLSTVNFPAKRVLAALTLVLFVNYLDRYALSILIEGIKADLRLSDTQIGLLTGAAFALLYSTLALPVARVAEHKNRVVVLLVAVLTWSTGTLLCGFAGSFAALFVARMLVGSGESGAMPPAHSIVGDSYALERRGTALAILSTGGALGMALAPAIGGYLEVHFGWRATLMILGSLGLPIALLLATVVKDPPRGLSDGARLSKTPPPPFKVALARLMSRPAFVLLIPGTVMIGLAEYSLFLWLPSFFARTYGGTAAEVGSQLTVFQGIPLLIGTLAGGLISDRLIKRDERWLAWLPALACGLAAPAIGALFAVRSHELALGLLVPPSIALGLYLAPCYTMLQTLAGARTRATATALLTFLVNVIGLGLGPLLLGAISDMLHARYGADSLRYSFFVIPPLYLTASAIFLIASRFLQAGLAAARQETLAS